MPPSPGCAPTFDNAIWSMLLGDFVGGRLPYVRSVLVFDIPSMDALVPEDAVVIRRIDHDTRSDWLFEGDGYRGRIESTIAAKGASVVVFAAERDTAVRIAEGVRARCPERPQPDGVHLTLWFGASSRSRRRVAAPTWADVEHNYPAGVRAALDALVRFEPATDGGRVVLLHGEPGTGKTTAIRMLLWEWRRWARADIVTDGDQLLHDSAYLAEVTSADPGDGWQVIVLEDAGNLVDEDLLGGDISRLLNLSDGIAGAGSRTLFVLTTNQRIGSPHSAITRPGRCIANITFERFTRREAVSWLGTADVPPDGLTLAELYDRRSSAALITNVAEPASHGVYV